VGVVSKLSYFLDVGASSLESLEDFVEISTLLHGNNSELIFFVNPDEECLLIVVEDTSTLWPFSVQVASFQESIAFPKNKL